MKLFSWLHRFSVKANLCWIARAILYIVVMIVAMTIGWFLGGLIPPTVATYTVVILGVMALLGLFYLFFTWLFNFTLIPIWQYLDRLILKAFDQQTMEEQMIDIFRDIDLAPVV